VTRRTGIDERRSTLRGHLPGFRAEGFRGDRRGHQPSMRAGPRERTTVVRRRLKAERN